jgi:membrane-associated protein
MLEGLLTFITGLGWLAVLAVIYAESGLLIGFFLPGDSLLFTAGFLVHQNIFTINIHLFVFLLFVAAVLGDSTGYAFGSRLGRKLFERENSRFFRKENLVRAENFYKKHGAKTIVLARFIPVIRTFAPIVAGMSSMRYRTFLAYNVIGAFIWTAGFTYLGFFAGKILNDLGINIELAVILIIFISTLPLVLHPLMNARRRRLLIEGTKREIQIVFGQRKR